MKQALRYAIGWLCMVGNLWGQTSHLQGDERIHWQQYQTDSAYRAATDYLEQHLYRQAQQGRDGQATRGVLTIPVVVHVMHMPYDTVAGQGSYISEQQVRRGLDWLNQAFRNRGDFAGGPFYSDAKDLADVVGVDTKIEFCLADQAPDGTSSSGIRYHSTMLANVDFADQVPGQTITEDQALKDLSFWDSNRYLNLWLVNSVCEREGQVCELRGYAYLPGIHGTALDGVVVEGDFWGSNLDSMAVPIYYVGRYLNLWPTSYRNVNSTPCENGDCLLSGDRVCDTPPDNQRGGPACGQVANTCDTDGADPDSSRNPFAGFDVQDLYENFMDLGPDLTCANHFTAGQKRRMRETLLTARSSLLNSLGCSSLRFSASIDSLQPLPGCEVLVTLTNTSGNRIDSLMLLYRWAGQQDTLFWQGQLPPAASVGITISPDNLTSGQTVSLLAEVLRLNDQSATANAPFAKANLTYLCPEPGANCQLPGQIPSMPGFYQATRVCVGADGWTHFIQSDGDASASDLLLLSVRSPDGREQDWQASRVSLWLNQDYGAGGHDLSHAPYVDNATGWHSSARYVQAWPKLKAPGLEVRLYFDELDLADIAAGLSSSGLAAPEALTPWVVDDSRSGNPADGHLDVAPEEFRWYDGYQRGGVPSWELWQGPSYLAARLRCDSLGGAGLGSGKLGLGYGPHYPQALLGVAGVVEADGHHLRWQSQQEWDEVSWELWQSWEGQPFRRLRRMPGHNLGLGVDSLTDYAIHVPGDSLGPGQYAYFVVARHRSGYAQHSDTLRLDWEGQGQGQVEIYPNPSAGPLRVAVDVTAGTPIRFEILDGTRRQLRAYQWRKGDPVPEMTLTGMPRGLYFYQLSTDVMAVQGKLLYLPGSR